MVSPKPSRVRIRTYQVGFGDCLLITVGYPRALPDQRTERHILVDFGYKVRAKGGPRLTDLAERIAEHCGGKLDVVVVTHRHQDHLRGFGDAGSRKHLDALAPSLIVRPWTDMPEAERSAQPGLDDDSLGFLNLLDAVGDQNDAVDQQFAADGRVLSERAKELAELGVRNVRALSMLEEWAPPEKHVWVRAGDVVDVGDIVPGIRVEVLGPPTLDQVPAMKSYASSSAEYWLGMIEQESIQPALLAPTAKDELVPAKKVVAEPAGLGRASWLLDRLHDQAPRQVLEIVEGFEEVLNNTSVILLVTVGARRILLTGDAQVESWSHPLERALGSSTRKPDRALRRRLSEVDVYKIGHHGSRNATPRRLVELWSRSRDRGHELTSLLSTRTGTYGTTAEGQVPKPELIQALERLGRLHTTEALPDDVWWFDVEAPAADKSVAFAYAAGAPQS